MRTVAIIPSRMASTRFPGKPLADILGLPMIEHVRRRALLSPALSDVIVATCDKEIFNSVKSFGGKVVMTSRAHERCTDRIAEAAAGIQADVIVNIQGDEPLLHPNMIKELVELFEFEPKVLCTNLMAEIIAPNEFESKDVVKTVCLPNGNALYFSREPIPSASHSKQQNYKKYRQLGIIAFRHSFLQEFAALKPTPLEEIESVDMLRAVEHGYPVRMVVTKHRSIGVDTPGDLDLAVEFMRQDELAKSYLRNRLSSGKQS